MFLFRNKNKRPIGHGSLTSVKKATEDNQSKQAVSEMKTFKNKMAVVVADRHSVSYFRSRGLLLLCVSTQTAKWFGWRNQKLVFRKAAMTAILDFQSAGF